MKHILTIISLILIFSGPGLNLNAQKEALLKPKIFKPVYFDVSPPLRDMVQNAPVKADMTWKDGIIKNFENPRKKRSNDILPESFIDPVIQQYYPNLPLDTTVQNFDGTGMPNGDGWPPDTDGDVGPNHYFQVINCRYAIYNKSGVKLLGPTASSTIWTGLPNNANDGDAIVLYDEQADRWLFSQFSLPNYPNGPFYEMVAVSQTGDPTGSWYRWEFSFADMPDYPKFGIWPDGYYLSCNRFTSGTLGWAGTYACVLDRTAMIAGNASPTMVEFSIGNTGEVWSMLPSDCDGTFPATGTPNYFTYLGYGSPYHLGIYEYSVNWSTPGSSSFGNFDTLNVATFNDNFGTGRANISQPGTSNKVDAIADRVMFRQPYVKYSDHASMVLNHTVNVGSNVAGIRWYELRNYGSGWTLYQQSTFNPGDGKSRWMGSIALDKNGNIALGYSISNSTTQYPSIRYTGRLVGDTPNSMTYGEHGIVNGTGSQTTYDRWGDYSAMSIDPGSTNLFWYTQEYYTAIGTSWKTRIASFQLPPNPLTADFNADNLTPPLNTDVNFRDYSIGSPTGWSWSFSPGTVVYVGGTSSSSQNPKVQFTAGGPYTVTLIASNGGGSSTKVRTNYIRAGIAGLWTGVTSTDWNTLSNWQNYLVPGNNNDVTVPTSAPNWPVYSGDLTLGGQIRNLSLTGTGQLSVTGSLTIYGGNMLSMTGAGYLGVGANWYDYGTFSPASGTVEFIGASTSKIATAFSSATLNNYTLSTFAKSMTPLSGGTAGPAGDDVEMLVNIGFTFNYLGVNYTQALISTNGYISMNPVDPPVTWENAYLFTPDTPNSTLAPWWDDLITTGGNIYYKTEGSAPNRVFTVEWNSVKAYVTGASASLNFQVKLYESTNTIEFCYGSVSGGNHNQAESASLGVEDATGGSGHFIDGTTGSMTTGNATLKSNANWPTVNYRFAPPALPTETFYNLYFNKPNTIFSIERNLLINGEFHLKP